MPRNIFLWGLCALVSLLHVSISNGQEKKPKKPKVVAGKADVLRHVPKKFATFRGFDPETNKVSLQVEGEDAAKDWLVLPEAEIKVHGWWGRAEQLVQGDRVWVWFAIDHEKKPIGVWMLADELSEQDIHDEPHEVKAVEGSKVTVQIPMVEKLKPRTLQAAKGTSIAKVGTKIWVQTAGDQLREILTQEEFEERRSAQKDWLKERWRKEGLPGAISVLHPLGGEMDVLLDHEAIRWARFQTTGSKVKIVGTRTTEAVVKSVSHWREKTLIRVVTNSGLGQLGMRAGERVKVIVPEPPAEVQASNLPTDLGRVEGKQARIDWFLASTYCTCGVGGDRCTGMFYIQESCNVNACGMPKQLSGEIARKIDEGKTDLQIYNELLEDRGRDLWQPHLLR